MTRADSRLRLLPLLALLFLPSCAQYFKFSVGGDRLREVHSVFLIAADSNVLKKSDKDPSRLVHPDRIDKYLLFAQFSTTEEGGKEVWKQEDRNIRSSQLKLNLSQDGKTLTVTANKKMLEPIADLAIIAVGRGDTWFGAAADSGTIRIEDRVHYNVSARRFVAEVTQ